jgi:hypothetical protein
VLDEDRDVYCLEAVIGSEPVLRELAGSMPKARIVSLRQGLWLLPMTDALFRTLTIAEDPELDGFWKAPAGLGSTLAACSAKGPVAYVEADYFGGAGTQCVQVWDGGKVVSGPLRLTTAEPLPDAGTAISQALRQLGAARSGYADEFDAVGLGASPRDAALAYSHELTNS